MDRLAFAAKGRPRMLLGDAFLEEVRGKTVIDFAPIRKLRSTHCKWTREWTAAIVRARLQKTQ